MPRPKLNLFSDLKSVEAICRQYGVARLSLFGSATRDDFTDSSDIDVLCTLGPQSRIASLMDWIHLKQALEDVWGRSVDLVEPDLLDDLIRDEVLGEERLIYVAPS